MMKRHFALVQYSDGIETLDVTLMNFDSEEEFIAEGNRLVEETKQTTDDNIYITFRRLPDIYSIPIAYVSLPNKRPL